jgi:hypothetical protein
MKHKQGKAIAKLLHLLLKLKLISYERFDKLIDILTVKVLEASLSETSSDSKTD